MVVDRAVELESDYIIIHEEANFRWHRRTLESAEKYWQQGTPFAEMVDSLNPRCKGNYYVSKAQREFEVFLILAYLRMEGRIEDREGAIWGS